MTLNQTDALRIKLEGRLEIMEVAIASLEKLEGLLRTRTWAQASSAFSEWEAARSKLDEAQEAARRVGGAEAQLARLRDVQARLGPMLDERLPKTAVARAAGFEAKLKAWQQLAMATGRPARTETPLLATQSAQPSPWWLAILAQALVLIVAGRGVLGGALVLVALYARASVQRVVRYSLFADVLVVSKPNEASVEVPLRSFGPGEISAGRTLEGLIDVELPFGSELEALAAGITRVVAEREVLDREEAVLARFSGPAGNWRRASLQPSAEQGSSAVEVLHFAKAAGAHSSRPPVRVTADERRGWALLSSRGLLFIPRTTEPSVRGVLFGTEPVELLWREQRPLEQLPEALLFEHLDALRRMTSLVWCDATTPLRWRDDSLETPAGLLRVTLDDSSRSMLRDLWR